MKKNIWIFNHYAGPPKFSIWTRHFNFAKKLIKNGYEVNVFTSSAIHNTSENLCNNNEDYILESYEGVPFVYIKTNSYQGNGFNRIKNMFQFFFGLFKAAKEFEKPDVIIASSPHPLTCIAGLLIAKKLKVKCIVEIRDLWPFAFTAYHVLKKNNILMRTLYGGERWIYKKADQLIFTMEGGKDYILDQGWEKDIDLNKVHHINNGVNLQEFEYNKKNYQFNDEDLDDTSIFKVIYVGAIRLANNLKQLIDCAELLKNDKSIKFILYGEGTDKKELEEYCRVKKINNVMFKGQVNKRYIPYILSKSDLNIINYMQAQTWKYGGSQNKLFEYFASGRPVCANIEMAYCLIKKYNCGISGDILSSGVYAEKILNIKNQSKNEYNEMCENALKAANDYDFSILTEKLEKVINY